MRGAPDPDPTGGPDDRPARVPYNQATQPNNFFNFFHYSFSTQNVRSLNLSTRNDITSQKILAICSLNTDFILLSDIRLNSAKQKSAINDITKKFFLKGYKLFYNSPGPSRGVGILIKKKIMDNNFDIINEECDVEGNFFSLNIKINELQFVVTAIYGPNHDDEIAFFNNLAGILKRYRYPLIIGGDWNATLDTSRVNSNVDVLNMQNLPSIRRSEALNTLCSELDVADPFRLLYPTRKEYTFIPSARNNINRSRLDFFLISKNLFNLNTECSIPHSLTTTFFDHKPVRLSFSKKPAYRKEIVRDLILNQQDLPNHVRSAVYECYLQHHLPTVDEDDRLVVGALRNKLESIGRINMLQEEIY